MIVVGFVLLVGGLWLLGMRGYLWAHRWVYRRHPVFFPVAKIEAMPVATVDPDDDVVDPEAWENDADGWPIGATPPPSPLDRIAAGLDLPTEVLTMPGNYHWSAAALPPPDPVEVRYRDGRTETISWAPPAADTMAEFSWDDWAKRVAHRAV